MHLPNKAPTETRTPAASDSDVAVTSAAQKEWSFRRWTAATCLVIFVTSVAIVLANIWIDVFGLYWRNDATYHLLERYSYHLLSYRYIPNHFDEILLGNSQNDNWDTSLIPGHRIFNVSAGASNLHEQIVLAQKVFETGHLKGVYIFMYPSMMNDVGLRTAYVTDKDRLSALGSAQNALIYAKIARDSFVTHFLRHGRSVHSSYLYGGHYTSAGKQLKTRPASPPDFWDIQPVAREDLRNLLNQCHAKGTQVYFVIPALYAPYYEQSKAKYDAFYRQMAAIGGPDVIMIDLLHDPSLQQIRQTRADYPDMLHPTTEVTRPMMQAMGRQIAAPSHQIDF